MQLMTVKALNLPLPLNASGEKSVKEFIQGPWNRAKNRQALSTSPCSQAAPKRLHQTRVNRLNSLINKEKRPFTLSLLVFENIYCTLPVSQKSVCLVKQFINYKIFGLETNSNFYFLFVSQNKGS